MKWSNHSSTKRGHLSNSIDNCRFKKSLFCCTADAKYKGKKNLVRGHPSTILRQASS